MQVYKCFMKIFQKKWGQVVMYLGIFLVLGIIMTAQAVHTKDSEFKAESYRFCVFDEDDSAVSRGLCAHLDRDNERVEIPDEKTAIQDELYNRNVHCVIRVPRGFGDSLREKNVSAEASSAAKVSVVSVPGTVYGEVFESEVDGYVRMIRCALAGGFDEEEAISLEERAAGLSAQVELNDPGRSGERSLLYYSFRYVPYLFICMCVVTITPMLIVFQKKKIRERIAASSCPANRFSLILFAGVVTVGAILCMAHLALAAALSGGDIFSAKGALFALNEFCFLIVVLGLVYLLGQVVKRQEVLNMIANLVGLGCSFLCGVFVPLELMGEGVIRAAHFLPPYWYVRAADWIDRFRTGDSLAELFPLLGVELLFGAVLVCAGMACRRGKSVA